MPSQQEVRWSQLKVGLLVIVALVTLTVLVLLMSNTMGGGLFTAKIQVRAYFENAAGLVEGAPVNLEGVAIGDVKHVRIVTTPARKLTPVEVDMEISSKYRQAVHKDSLASLNTIGVLGDTVVDLNSQQAIGPPVQSGDELATTETPSLNDVIKASQGTVQQLNTILAKVDKMADAMVDKKGTMGLLLNDPTLYNRANDSMGRIQKILVNVDQGKGSLGKLVADDQLYDRLNATIGKLESITAEIDEGKGTAGKLIKDPSLYNNANQTLAKLNSLMTDINEGKGGIGVMAKDPQFAAKLKDSITQLDDLLGQVNAGQGTVGKLMKDPSLYDNADKTMAEANLLVATIRKDPKKYLTIHLKIF